MKTELQQEIRTLLTRLEMADSEPKVKTMPEAITAFLNGKRVLAPTTFESYTKILEIFNRFCDTWPVTPEQIEAYFAYLAGERGIKAGGIHGHYRVLKAWFNWLVKRELIFVNPIQKVTAPPRPDALPRAPKESDLHALFAAIKTHAGRDRYVPVRDLAIFTMLLDTGLRVGELLRLELDDIDHEHLTAHIRETKTKKQRIVAFSPHTAKRLSAWLKLRAALGIPAGVKRVFVANRFGTWQSFKVSSLRSNRDVYCSAAGINTFRLHDLRHACAIFFLRGGGDLLDIQQQLGHSSLLTTERYLKVTDAGRPARFVKHSPLSYLERAA